MVAIGMFEGERVELLYGRILRMSPRGPGHDGTIQRLTHLLVDALGKVAAVRVQSAFAANDGSEPEPDIAIVPPGDYFEAHPSTAWLIIEVAASSLDVDRVLKAKLYAECGVPEYWVVNLVDNIIEARTEIVHGTYARVTPYRKGNAIRLVQFPQVEIQASNVLR